jgi:PAS domain S-box-containing protein
MAISTNTNKITSDVIQQLHSSKSLALALLQIETDILCELNSGMQKLLSVKKKQYKLQWFDNESQVNFRKLIDNPELNNGIQINLYHEQSSKLTVKANAIVVENQTYIMFEKTIEAQEPSKESALSKAYNLIFDNHKHIHFFIVDKNGRFNYCSNGFLNWMQSVFSIDVKVGSHITDTFKSETSVLVQNFEQALAGKSLQFLHEFIFNDSTLYVEVYMAPLASTNHTEKGVSVYLHDISKQQTLTEAKYSALIQNFDETIIYLDLHNCVTHTKSKQNRSQNTKLIGQSIFNFIDDEYHDMVKQSHDTIVNSMQAIGYKISGIAAHGKKSWFHIKATPVIKSNSVVGFMLISQEISAQKKSEEDIAHFLSLLEATIESTADGILLVDKSGKISLYNKKFLELWRIPSAVLELRDDKATLQYVINQLKFPEAFLSKVQWLYDKPDEICFDVIEFLDGRVFERYSQAQLINGEYAGRVWSFRDVTSRLLADEAIRQSLKEKEVLLKEIHHRVKNNLQIISSILNLQASNINDEQTLDLMRDSQSRIRCMAYIHELLYQNKDFSSINFKEYITSIANSLLFSYSIGRQVKLILDLQDVYLDIDVAISCGLIVNELLTNSLKYAFNVGQANKTIRVSIIETNSNVKMLVADNGKGLSPIFNFESLDTLGMQLVHSLVDQIDGTVTIRNNEGVAFEIQFKNIRKK